MAWVIMAKVSENTADVVFEEIRHHRNETFMVTLESNTIVELNNLDL